MCNTTFHRVSLLLVMIVLLAMATPALADFGPKPNDRQHFAVTFAGGPLPDARFVAGMLYQRLESREAPLNMGAVVPGLKLALPPGDSAGNWTYASYRWGGKGANGQVEFHGFVSDIPKTFRVVVYLPSQDKIFITNEAKTHALLNRFHVNLSPDGTATLVRDPSGQWLADGLVGLAQRGMFKALAITLVIELLVVVCLVLGLRKRPLLARLAVTCLCVNLFTLPLLWVTCLIGFWMFGLWAGIVLLAVLELMVVFLEGSAYAIVGRLGWKLGLAVAFLANATSFLLGLIISH